MAEGCRLSSISAVQLCVTHAWDEDVGGRLRWIAEVEPSSDILAGVLFRMLSTDYSYSV